MKTLKVRYNPFKHRHEVLEFEVLTNVYLLHDFDTEQEAVKCKQNMLNHRKLFGELE